MYMYVYMYSLCLCIWHLDCSVSIQVLRSAARWSAGITETEMSIQTAYLHLIDTAKHFIYIENQFFISIAGHASLKNKIADALYNRIIRAYQYVINLNYVFCF